MSTLYFQSYGFIIIGVIIFIFSEYVVLLFLHILQVSSVTLLLLFSRGIINAGGYNIKCVYTVICTSILLDTIEYYNENNTDCYILLLDASKAFDRVEYVQLFKLIKDRNVSYIKIIDEFVCKSVYMLII